MSEAGLSMEQSVGNEGEVAPAPTTRRPMLQTLCRWAAGGASRWRRFWYRQLGVGMGSGIWLRRVSIPRQWTDIRLESYVALDDGVVLLCSGEPRPGKLVIGEGTYINRYTILDAHFEIVIGERCMIGPHCFITDADHGKLPGIPRFQQPMSAKSVVLEENVWLGAGVTILKGVRVGRDSVIGAGAVVTHDIPAGSVVAGVPARPINIRSGAIP